MVPPELMTSSLMVVDFPHKFFRKQRMGECVLAARFIASSECVARK